MDIYAKIILISWIIIVTAAILDHLLFNERLLDFKYIGIVLAVQTWCTILLTPMYLIYFVLAVL